MGSSPRVRSADDSALVLNVTHGLAAAVSALVPHKWRYLMLARRWVVLLMICMPILLTACGHTDPSSVLGHSTAMPSSLRVVRYVILPSNEAAPLDRTVTSTLVQSLYTLIPSLPFGPKGDVSCPVDFGLRFELTFSRSSQVLMRAVASPEGCGTISWDTSEGRLTTEAFWSKLAQILGVPESQLLAIPTTRAQIP
ncbi:MAG: hypothetical protein OJF49_004270 [Ktedonobacterales bacterium]|jgi:hypothetical protein|nr:MAG: hypothetical protein OJF49_004270 [Ktedonobacterales bacterium]